MKLDTTELLAILTYLRSQPAEGECFEFKAASASFSSHDLGKYFSALSNEANLRSVNRAWLVFGVDDNTHNVVGTTYKPDRPHLDADKVAIADGTTGRQSFIEIYELELEGRRVVMFEIPPAPQGIPIAWKGHYYGREGESIQPLSTEKYERLRAQAGYDWSATIVPNATLSDLSSEAVAVARAQFLIKNPKFIEELPSWDDLTFLNKARLLLEGRVTRSALILLGKGEAAHKLDRALTQISWILNDEAGSPQDYFHFDPPFILAVDQLFGRIRNTTYRFMSDSSLFPEEITKYDPYVIREALHNCIAHQDYQLQGKINVVEKPDELVFANAGSFLPGSIEHVIESDAPSERYRNSHLAEAMVQLNMIDTIGSGIKRMFTKQRSRFFPLPEFDLTVSTRVSVKIYGRILNEKYSELLKSRPELDLSSVILLDKVQKHLRLDKAEIAHLRALSLVEGRANALYISSGVAGVLKGKSEYIRNRAFDDQHFQKMVLAYLEEYGSASRQDFESLLFEKLSDALSPQQKLTKISNLLMSMRYQGLIHPKGRTRGAHWHSGPEKREEIPPDVM